MGASPGNVRVLSVESRSRRREGNVQWESKELKEDSQEQDLRDSSTTMIKQKSKLRKAGLMDGEVADERCG